MCSTPMQNEMYLPDKIDPVHNQTAIPTYSWFHFDTLMMKTLYLDLLMFYLR